MSHETNDSFLVIHMVKFYLGNLQDHLVLESDREENDEYQQGSRDVESPMVSP